MENRGRQNTKYLHVAKGLTIWHAELVAEKDSHFIPNKSYPKINLTPSPQSKSENLIFRTEKIMKFSQQSKNVHYIHIPKVVCKPKIVTKSCTLRVLFTLNISNFNFRNSWLVKFSTFSLYGKYSSLRVFGRQF